MPELPEVETIRRDLERTLTGDHAVSIEVFDRRLMSRQEEERWKEILPGQAWQSFKRKGKYLWVELANQWRVGFHLRMTGQLLVEMASSPAVTGGGPMKPRLLIRFKSGRRLAFCDQRRFGEAWLFAPNEPWRSKNPLGPDALTELRLADFVQMVKKRTTRIHPLLMDQRLMSGVGNIYAQEALFKAAIRPTRPGCRVTKTEASRLFESLQETLQTAIAHRGSSSRNYRDTQGEEGSAQTLHSVYRKGGKPCPRCHGPLRAARVGGRGAVYCPQCQS
jgi:formamidopyrimidine-DNA glycosylase